VGDGVGEGADAWLRPSEAIGAKLSADLQTRCLMRDSTCEAKLSRVSREDKRAASHGPRGPYAAILQAVDMQASTRKSRTAAERSI